MDCRWRKVNPRLIRSSDKLIENLPQEQKQLTGTAVTIIAGWRARTSGRSSAESAEHGGGAESSCQEWIKQQCRSVLRGFRRPLLSLCRVIVTVSGHHSFWDVFNLSWLSKESQLCLLLIVLRAELWVSFLLVFQWLAFRPGTAYGVTLNIWFALRWPCAGDGT